MGRQDFETETLLAVGGFPDVAISIQAGCVRENPDSGPDGVGVREDGIAYTLEARAEVQACAYSIRTANTSSNGWGIQEETTHTLDQAMGVAVAMNLRGREGGAMPEMDDVASLRAASGGSSRSYVMYEKEDEYASTYEADASSVLSTLRGQVGAAAVTEWGSRILDSLQSAEVLQSWLHGESLRRSSDHFRSFVDDSSLSRSQAMPEGVLRTVWILGPNGRTSQGRGLAKQLARQLGKALPELPSARASESHQQSGLMAVRRLTPVECEKLQGFPPNYTRLSEKTADGPRYKALGNSMAVPVMRWIGERIQAVDGIE